MSEGTVQRLDFDASPPGYVVEEVIEDDPPPHRWRARCSVAYLDRRASYDDAHAAAWAHHKARFDPPGGIDRIMLVWGVADWGVPAARWAWYARRLALSRRLDSIFIPGHGIDDFWPRILTWSDGQVAAVEVWITDRVLVGLPALAAALPEALHG